MRRLLSFCTVVVLLSCNGWGGTVKKENIYNIVVKTESFSTLAKAIGAAGLTGTLESKGPYTLFAPTDSAFQALPSGTLENLMKPENKAGLVEVLTYHLVPGKYTMKDLEGMKMVTTVQGEQLTLEMKDGKLYVDGAMVEDVDMMASNGVIHGIDKVLMPPKS